MEAPYDSHSVGFLQTFEGERFKKRKIARHLLLINDIDPTNVIFSNGVTLTSGAVRPDF